MKLKKLHIATIIAGIIFVTLGIFHTNLWFDETYSVGMAGKTFIDIWNIGGHDVHPILYYWMLHILYLLTGGSILAYRIFSSIAIIILGILGYTHIRKDFGEKTGYIFSFLAYFLPFSAVYANEIRMYSWALLFITVLGIYAWRLAHGDERKRNYIIFFLSSLRKHIYTLLWTNGSRANKYCFINIPNKNKAKKHIHKTNNIRNNSRNTISTMVNIFCLTIKNNAR